MSSQLKKIAKESQYPTQSSTTPLSDHISTNNLSIQKNSNNTFLNQIFYKESTTYFPNHFNGKRINIKETRKKCEYLIAQTKWNKITTFFSPKNYKHQLHNKTAKKNNKQKHLNKTTHNHQSCNKLTYCNFCVKTKLSNPSNDN